jgi:hypothetical protein
VGEANITEFRYCVAKKLRQDALLKRNEDIMQRMQ